ncbi:DUF433 domain-containing protein [Bryobacter aggregatus]|uniref:DUF433 domain-containing protein n=1 Tax=Bryobacter aggregatus TaxID=360054 RepID=UPI0004E27B17|nr:DUF433 domain-containing protein [Bryobacter aggregatus]
MSWHDRILVDAGILAGKPVGKETRLAVAFLLELIAAGESEQSLLDNYPGLTREDLLACRAFASDRATDPLPS